MAAKVLDTILEVAADIQMNVQIIWYVMIIFAHVLQITIGIDMRAM
jgi:hypothetical protein